MVNFIDLFDFSTFQAHIGRFYCFFRLFKLLAMWTVEGDLNGRFY